jgi:hypothetical protein
MQCFTGGIVGWTVTNFTKYGADLPAVVPLRVGDFLASRLAVLRFAWLFIPKV